MSSKSKGLVEVDEVSEYLLSLRRDTKKNDMKLNAVIEAHNDFVKTFKRYKKFYEDHQGSHFKIDQHGAQKQSSQDSPNLLKKLKKEKKELEFKNVSLQSQVGELKTRLSTVAGHKLLDGYAGIADLSDPFRPTQLAEKFREIYDEEWTRSFEELEIFLNDETKVIDTLTFLVNQVETVCSQFSEQQIKYIKRNFTEEIVDPKVIIDGNQSFRGKTHSEMSTEQDKTVIELIHDLRKSVGVLSVSPLVQIFDCCWVNELRKKKLLPPSSKETDAYIAKTFEIVWLMKIQRPQMEMQRQSLDEKCEKERFTFYTKRGDIVSQTVWPAVLLHKNGPLMSKGIIQAK